MNSPRTPPERIRECLRPASYQLDGARLYSNDEIAEQLGETPEWVAAVLYTNSAYEVRAPIVRPGNRPTNMTYDPGKPGSSAPGQDRP